MIRPTVKEDVMYFSKLLISPCYAALKVTLHSSVKRIRATAITNDTIYMPFLFKVLDSLRLK
jgi:hypothetical protein